MLFSFPNACLSTDDSEEPRVQRAFNYQVIHKSTSSSGSFCLSFAPIFRSILRMKSFTCEKSANAGPLALLCLLSAASLAAAQLQANWPRWRGPHDNGSTEAGDFPTKWEVEKVLWKAPLPGKGCSTPIVWDQRIYLTSPADGLDAVLAFDWSGKLFWQTTFGRENPGSHRNGSGSNASPATDGKAVLVYFKSGTLAEVEFDGKVRWQTNLVQGFGPDTLYWDHGASPVLTEKYVVMTRMHHGESWLAAFDKATGELRWKASRNYQTPSEDDNGYSTPLVIRQEGREALLAWGAEHVTLHDAAEGKLLWTCGGFNPELKQNWPTVSSLVVVGDVAVVPFGRADRGQPRLHGIKLGALVDAASGSPSASATGRGEHPGSANVPAGERIWKREDTGAFVPTPAVYEGRVFILRDRGEVECLDPATGKTVWSGTFPKASANFYASPLIAKGKLYAAREDGVVFVANVDGKFELLAENKMGERVIASPVAVSHRLFIRAEQHLFCVASPD